MCYSHFLLPSPAGRPVKIRPGLPSWGYPPSVTRCYLSTRVTSHGLPTQQGLPTRGYPPGVTNQGLPTRGYLPTRDYQPGATCPPGLPARGYLPTRSYQPGATYPPRVISIRGFQPATAQQLELPATRYPPWHEDEGSAGTVS